MGKAIDLVGQRFGKWLVLARADKNKNESQMFLCRCECGTEKLVRGAHLRAGDSKNCGCINRKIVLSGKRFGRLVVIKQDEGKHHKPHWLCRCDCGVEIIVSGSHLRGGITQSCGCLRSEVLIERSTKHGGYGTPEYNSWCAMIQRCTNPKKIDYENYGGRGITICERWRDNFEYFLSDMGYRPGPEYSIDRIDVNGNYEPLNCRWATAKEQRANQRPRVKK